MATEATRQFGAYLRRLRGKQSQADLAAKLCRATGTASVTRHEVSRWERGERIPDVWLPALAEVLGVDLRALTRAADAARRPDDPLTSPEQPASLADFLPEGEPLWTLGTGRLIGQSTAASLTARVHGLRLADDVLPGGDLVRPALRQLAEAVKLFKETSHTEEVSRALLVAIGELAQIVGWIASDAGQHADAERAYRLGMSAAREAGAGALAGNLAGSLAYQLSNTGREREGLDLARAGLAEAPDAHPTARAMALDRLAWAHTRAGEAQPAMRALGEAHDALTADATDPAPVWAYWMSQEEAEVMDARVFTELRRPLRAVPLLAAVLDRYDASHTREFALYLSWLVVALADANEPEQAAEHARRVLELTNGLASDRTAERSRVVLDRLRPFADVPEVADVLDQFAA
ncbi:transcriptional regulator [Kitasatospora sp. NPDC058184]|uniref:transcriptional regulator n=1 Tax=Kitasatospora sp. NPDC058184 TaxID=3346370 RepID=UPI0036D98994